MLIDSLSDGPVNIDWDYPVENNENSKEENLKKQGKKMKRKIAKIMNKKLNNLCY